MENLVGRKVRVIKGFYNTTVGKEYEIISSEDRWITIVEDDGYKQDYDIYYIDNGDLELIVDEWMPKQGDKVLVSDDGIKWESVPYFYELAHDNAYYCYRVNFNSEVLNRFKFIKPYKEEIKVGDWITKKGANRCFKYTSNMKPTDKWIKITNQQLVTLLENEL